MDMSLQQIAKHLPTGKVEWSDYFFSVALLVSSRADCTRRQFGCIAVSPDNRIVATGYNSPPPGEDSAVQRFFKKKKAEGRQLKCDVLPVSKETQNEWRKELPGCCKVPGAPANQGYDCCNAVHAEQNAIMQLGVNNHYEYVDLYIAGRNGLTGEILDANKPCIMCSRFIKSANVRDIYCLRADQSFDLLRKEQLKTTA